MEAAISHLRFPLHRIPVFVCVTNYALTVLRQNVSTICRTLGNKSARVVLLPTTGGLEEWLKDCHVSKSERSWGNVGIQTKLMKMSLTPRASATGTDKIHLENMP